MSGKERILYLIIWVFIITSLATGFIPSVEGEPCNCPMTVWDNVYFTLQQACEILLLYGLYTIVKHYKLKYILKALMALSAAELIDVLLSIHATFKISDYVLVAGVLYVVYKQIQHVKIRNRGNSNT